MRDTNGNDTVEKAFKKRFTPMLWPHWASIWLGFVAVLAVLNLVFTLLHFFLT